MWTSDWSHLVSVSALWRHKFRSRCSSSITEQASSVSSSGVLSKCFCIVQIKGLGLVFFDTWSLNPSICDSLCPTSSNSSDSSNSHLEVSYQSYHLPCQLQTARSTHHWPSSSGTSFPRSSGTSPGNFEKKSFGSRTTTAALAVARVYYVLLSVPQTASTNFDVPMCHLSKAKLPRVSSTETTPPSLNSSPWSGVSDLSESEWRNDARPKCDFGCSFESETPTSLQCTMQAMAVMGYERFFHGTNSQVMNATCHNFVASAQVELPCPHCQHLWSQSCSGRQREMSFL